MTEICYWVIIILPQMADYVTLVPDSSELTFIW